MDNHAYISASSNLLTEVQQLDVEAFNDELSSANNTSDFVKSIGIDVGFCYDHNLLSIGNIAEETYISSNISQIHHDEIMLNTDVESIVVLIDDDSFVIDDNENEEDSFKPNALIVYVNNRGQWKDDFKENMQFLMKQLREFCTKFTLTLKSTIIPIYRIFRSI